MKKIFILKFAILITLSSYSQEIKVKWGAEMKKPKGWFELVGKDNTGFYVKRQKGKKNYVDKYKSSDLSLDYTSEIPDIKKDKKSLTHYRTIYLKDQLVMFSTFEDKKEDKHYLYAHYISKKGVISDKMKSIDVISNTKGRDIGYFGIVLSKDSTKLLVKHIPIETKEDKNSKSRVSYKVYDTSLDLLWSKTVTFSKPSDLFDLDNYTIDNNGNLYMVSHTFADKKDARKNEIETLNLLNYDYQSGQLKSYNLTLGDNYWISDLSLAMGSNNNVYVGGFYKRERKNGFNGTFTIVIDGKTKEVIGKNLKPFSEEFLAEFVDKKKSEKKQKKTTEKLEDSGISTSYTIDYFKVRKDGSGYFIAESYYMTTHTSTVNGQTRTYYTYHYLDLIVVNFDHNGVITWANRIPKKQVSSGTFYSGYTYLEKEGKLFILFNDHPKNFDAIKAGKNLNNSYSAGKKQSVTLVVIDKDGKLTRKKMFDSKDVETILVTKYSTQIGNELILYGQKGSKVKFGKVQVQ